MKSPGVAMYPGTFDPITHGHTDLVTRAARVFNKVIVAIAESPHKTPFFSLEKRIALAETQLGHLDNIEIVGFSNLLVDFAQDKGASIIVRGLRAVSDFEFEFQMALMNRKLNEKIETLFMMPRASYSFLSSHLVKEIAGLGGDVSTFVSQTTRKALVKKLEKSSSN